MQRVMVLYIVMCIVTLELLHQGLLRAGLTQSMAMGLAIGVIVK